MNGNNKNIKQPKAQPQVLLEAPKKFPLWLAVLITVVVTAVIVSVGGYFLLNFLTQGVDNGDIVKFNCEQSGGLYNNETCECSGEEFYEEETGYCIAANGSPGGELGDQARELLEARVQETTIEVMEKIVEFNCQQSGGEYLESVCNCSEIEDATYEEETGYCVMPDGSPDGELGEQAKKLLELKTLKSE